MARKVCNKHKIGFYGLRCPKCTAQAVPDEGSSVPFMSMTADSTVIEPSSPDPSPSPDPLTFGGGDSGGGGSSSDW